MVEIRVSEYDSREELDVAVRALTIPQIPDGAILVGTEDELRAKHLSKDTTVWGVPCKIIE